MLFLLRVVISVSFCDISVDKVVNVVSKPLIFVVDSPLSLIVACFPCIASSTSPIIGSVIPVFTSTEPLTIKLLLTVPPLFYKYRASNSSKSMAEEEVLL